MDFNYIKDLKYAKEITELSDEEFAAKIGTNRMTYYRWTKAQSIPNKSSLEMVYSNLYSSNIRINKLKEELYKSSENANRKILYHGAKSEIVGDITVERSEDKKDFGKGFYVGETLLQSASFVSNYKNSSVYVIEFDKPVFDVSKEWMVLISYFRGKIDEYKESKYLKELLKQVEGVDVIIAPIADNTMYEILDDFSNGGITDLQCLHALSANWLGKQYVFLNDKVIKSSLKIIDRLYVCEKEKEDYRTKREENTTIGKEKVKLAKRQYAGKGQYIEELLK